MPLPKVPAARANPTRRRWSFPFLLSVLLFVVVVADAWLSDAPFVTSRAYREQGSIPIGLAVFGFLLWLWVLGAARRRSTRFEGPVLDARGSNGALQPILATLFIVIGLNVAYVQTIPRWLNGLFASGTASELFATVGGAVQHKRGCDRVPARNPNYGEVSLCIEGGASVALGDGGGELSVSGPQSWFGIEAQQIVVADATNVPELTVTPTLTVDSEPSARRGPRSGKTKN